MTFIDSLQSCKVSCITTIDCSTEYIKVFLALGENTPSNEKWVRGKISRENRIC